MQVGEIIDVSNVDIPNIPSMVIFTIGCNLNCQFCQNGYLHQRNLGRFMDINEILSLVKSNSVIRGVYVTGGEPTLQKDLFDLCKELRNLGKYVSLDTNGTHPEIVNNILPYSNKIILNLKSPLKKKRYSEITSTNIDPNLIFKTFSKLNNQNIVDFEIRTIYVENAMNPNDIHEIIKFLKKNKFRGQFVLQQYEYFDGIGEKYKEIYYMPEHSTLLKIVEKYKNVNLPFKIYLRDNIIGYKNINDINGFWE
jgi:pyruvate formate lyase activating enzyme